MKTIGMYIRKLTAFVLVAVLGTLMAAGTAGAADLSWAAGFPKVADGNALLMWDTVAGAEKYKVYRKRGTGEYNLLTSVGANRHIDKDVPAGHTFTYKVVAVKGDAQLAESGEKSLTIAVEKAFVPLATPKLIDAKLGLSPDDTPNVGLRWEVKEEASELAGYNVYRSLKKGGAFELIGTSQGVSYKDSDIKRGNTYRYVVTAIDNNFNETAYSNEVSVEAPVIEVYIPEGKKPTPMRRARHLFDIKTYKENNKVKNLEFPIDVVVDDAVGHIYVLTRYYGGILVYDMDGKFQFGIRRDGANTKTMVKGVHGLGIGPNGWVYMSDYHNPYVYVYDFMGKQVQVIEVDLQEAAGIKDKTAKVFDLSVNSQGDVYMSDAASQRILVYDYRGKFKFGFGPFNEPDRNKTFNGPSFSAIDSKDNFYVVDSVASRLLKYDANGNYLAIQAGAAKTGMGEAGSLFYPAGVTVDSKDRVLVANSLDPNVQAFGQDSKFIYATSNEGKSGPIKSSDMRGIFVDGKERLYVCEVMSGTVAVYQYFGDIEEVTTPSTSNK